MSRTRFRMRMVENFLAETFSIINLSFCYAFSNELSIYSYRSSVSASLLSIQMFWLLLHARHPVMRQMSSVRECRPWHHYLRLEDKNNVYQPSSHRVDTRTSVMSTRTFRTPSISVIWISDPLHFSYYQIVFRWEQWIRADALCGNTVPNPWSKCQIYGHSAILCLRDLWILCIFICCRIAAENRGGRWYMISCWFDNQE
jgi:hypothetical protein